MLKEDFLKRAEQGNPSPQLCMIGGWALPTRAGPFSTHVELGDSPGLLGIFLLKRRSLIWIVEHVTCIRMVISYM